MDWLMKILGMQNGGPERTDGPMGGIFGRLGGSGVGGGGILNPNGPGMRPPMMPAPSPASVPMPNNNGMPMSGVGPGGAPMAGAPMNIMPQGSGSPGLWSGGSPSPAGSNLALGQAMNLIKGPQFQPTQWMPWMPMGGRG